MLSSARFLIVVVNQPKVSFLLSNPYLSRHNWAGNLLHARCKMVASKTKTLVDFFPQGNSKRAKISATTITAASVSENGDVSTPLSALPGLAPSCDPSQKTDSSAVAASSLTDDQKMKIEINKSLAKWKRNRRVCSEKVLKAKAEGGYANLEELLVENTWLEALVGEFQKPYAKTLFSFVKSEICGGNVPIYPPQHLIFNALNSTPFDKVKVVILGQDPYHGPGQAMGLAFSVPEGIKIPSSLVNIFKELKQDLGCSLPADGNLERWAIQGVLLLNTVLTVRSHQANSHAKKGWEQFTDSVIRTISEKKRGVVFLLWGNSAQEKSRLINATKHHILKAAHPSGLSAHRGFFDCRHFSQTNKILQRSGETPIDWQL